MRPWTKREIEKLVDWTLDGIGPHELGRRLRRCGQTIRGMQIELELIKESTIRRRWTKAEEAIVRAKYENTPASEIAKELGRYIGSVYQHATGLGLKKSKETIAAMARERSLRDGHGSHRTRFAKGIVPHNKGLRQPGYAPGRMRETQFKKGSKPHTWRPIGTERLTKEGYLQRKVADTGRTVDDYVEVHRLMWEEAKGPIPPGWVLVFRDGDRAHIVLDNLELITRADLARRNTIHKLPEELKEVIRLKASIDRRIRKINAQKQNDRSAEPPVRDTRAA